MRRARALVWAAVLAVTASGAEASGPAEHHHHGPPHGGTLAALGNELAHLELVRDAERGSLTLYVLDAAAEGAIRLKAAAIPVRIRPRAPADGASLALELGGVANPLTGEKEADTSEYRGAHPLLREWSRFEVHLPRLVVRGVAFEDVRILFPEGSEPAGETPEETRHDH